jgi:hypothetical protein
MKRWMLDVLLLPDSDNYFAWLRPLGHDSNEMIVYYPVNKEGEELLLSDITDRNRMDWTPLKSNEVRGCCSRFCSKQEIIDVLGNFIEYKEMTDTSEIVLYDEKTKQEHVVWSRLKE